MARREKQQQRCQAREAEMAGDMWAHTAVTADSKLVVSLVVGKRTHEQTNTLVQDAKRRLRSGHWPALFTDAYVGSEAASLAAFGHRSPIARLGTKGRVPCSVLRWPQGFASGQVKKQEKGRRVERVEGRVLYGKARLKHVLYLLGYQQRNTSVIARHNGTSRLRNQRAVRKTLAFSQANRYHRGRSWLSGGLYNFCRGHGSLKQRQEAQVRHRRPARAAKLPEHIWTVRKWLLCPVLGGQG